MTYRKFCLFVRPNLRAGTRVAPVVVVRPLSCKRGVLSCGTLLQEFDLWSAREPEGGRISIDREFFHFENTLVPLEVDRTKVCDERLKRTRVGFILAVRKTNDVPADPSI